MNAILTTHTHDIRGHANAPGHSRPQYAAAVNDARDARDIYALARVRAAQLRAAAIEAAWKDLYAHGHTLLLRAVRRGGQRTAPPTGTADTARC